MPSYQQRTTQSSRRSAPRNNNTTMMYIFAAILIIIVIFGIVWISGGYGGVVDPFTQKVKNKIFGQNQNLRDLDILFFMSPTCGWCKKMKAVLEKENVLGDLTMVDMSQPQGKELAKSFGADKKGVPNFVSRKLKTGSVGFKESVKILLESLTATTTQSTQAPTQEQGSAVQNLDMVMFASPQCSWCNKAKEEIKAQGLGGVVEIVDISDPEGKKMMDSVITDFRGVPIFYSRKTKKSTVGYKPMDKVVVELN